MVKALDEKVIESLINQVEAPKRLGELKEFSHCCEFVIENTYLNGETIRLDAATRLREKQLETVDLILSRHLRIKMTYKRIH